MVYVEPRDGSGDPAPPAGLAAWRNRLVTALEVPGGFARFLTSQIGVKTHPDPPTRLGIRLDAHPSIAELVDTSGLVPVEGSSASTSFQHYLIAERAGQPPEEVAVDVLRVWCDHALRVEGYDGELARLQRRTPSITGAGRRRDSFTAVAAWSLRPFHGRDGDRQG